jgi:hypothetical protein
MILACCGVIVEKETLPIQCPKCGEWAGINARKHGETLEEFVERVEAFGKTSFEIHNLPEADEALDLVNADMNKWLEDNPCGCDGLCCCRG